MVNPYEAKPGLSKEAQIEDLKQYMKQLRPDELFEFMTSFRFDDAYLKPLLQEPPIELKVNTAPNETSLSYERVVLLPIKNPHRCNNPEHDPIDQKNPPNIPAADDNVIFNPHKWNPFESETVTKNSPAFPVQEENILFHPHKWNPFEPNLVQKNHLNMSVVQDSVLFNPPPRSSPLESDLLKMNPLNLSGQSSLLTDSYMWKPCELPPRRQAPNLSSINMLSPFGLNNPTAVVPNPPNFAFDGNMPAFPNITFEPNLVDPNLLFRMKLANPTGWNPALINALNRTMEDQFSSNQNNTFKPDELERIALAWLLRMKSGNNPTMWQGNPVEMTTPPMNLPPLEAINLNMFNPYEQALLSGKKRANPATMWNPMESDWVPVKRPNVVIPGGELGYFGDGGVMFNPCQSLPNVWNELMSSASGSVSGRANKPDESGPSRAPPSDGRFA